MTFDLIDWKKISEIRQWIPRPGHSMVGKCLVPHEGLQNLAESNLVRDLNGRHSLTIGKPGLTH